MLTAIGLYLVALSVGLLGLMVWQHHRGTHEFLSIRNLALLGFILFQLISAAIPMFSGRYLHFTIVDPETTGLLLALKATVFVVVLLFVYDVGWGAKSLAALVPGARAIPPDASLLIMSVVLTVVAAVLCIGIPVPLIGTVANFVGTGFAAIACGLVGWVWGRRLLNPGLIVLGPMVLLANLTIVASGAFGRRGLVAVGACLIWGMYYSHWRHLATGAMLRRVAIVSILPLCLLALYSSARHSGDKGRTAIQQVEAVTTRGDMREGFLMLLDGQNTGTVSMWLIENYPERFEQRPLMTIGYFFVAAWPRDWWQSKPLPLSTMIAGQARMEGVNSRGITIGPGILGSAAAEGGWYAVLLYAIAGGLFLRLLDQIVIRNPQTPFVVLPIGAALGQVVGMARGETSLFANIYVISVVGSYLSMLVIGKVIEWSGWRPLESLEHEDFGDDEAVWPQQGEWEPEAAQGMARLRLAKR